MVQTIYNRFSTSGYHYQGTEERRGEEREEEERERERERMQSLTSNEVAGFAVGALLLGATIAAPKVDAFIAAAQRR